MSKKFLHGLFGFLAGLAVFSLVVFAAPAIIRVQASGPLDVNGIHLTWAENDVYHTMAVSWWTKGPAKSVVLYDTEAHEGASGKYAFKAEGDKHKITTTRSTWDNWYHDVELTGLEPGTTYYFICGGPQNWSQEYSFRTIGLDQKVKFIFGGDSRAPGSSELEGPLFPEGRIAVSDAAATEEPDFVVFGGDMVRHGYNEEMWHAWLDDVPGRLVTEEGRIIPIVAVLGNHDCGYLEYLTPPGGDDMSGYDYYRGLFALPGNELWYTLDFPSIRLTVLLLAYGTGFAEPDATAVERTTAEVLEQVDWLEDQLKGAEQVDWLITTQHICIIGPFGHNYSTDGRAMADHWVPLFEEYGVDLNLSGHDHEYVRTWPIAHYALPEGFVDFDWTMDPREPGAMWPNGAPIIDLAHNSEEGVTYLVQGNWGAPMEWMEKDTWVPIYPEFASAYSRLSYSVIERTDQGLHVTTKAAKRLGWYGIPVDEPLDEFTLPYTTEEFPTAEYNAGF